MAPPDWAPGMPAPPPLEALREGPADDAPADPPELPDELPDD
jgi:hypothetical protein